jgi:tetratricopeptide (TPR) repeat protein
MLDQRLQALDRLIAERKLQEAVAWGEQLCRDHADCLPAQLSLSEAYRQQGRFQAAIEHAASAHDLNPDDEFARAQYARTLIPFADHQQIMLLLEQQRQHVKPNEWSDDMMAVAAASIDEWQLALLFYERLLKNQPRLLNALYMRGVALSVLGRRSEAIAAFRLLLDWYPDYGRAWWSLADLDPDTVDEKKVIDLLRDTNLADAEKVYLWQVLGQLQQRKAAYPDAFVSWENSNKIRRLMQPYHGDRWEKLVSSLLDYAQQFATVSADASSGHGSVAGGKASESPIFIVGLPRSGSTLVEQMISNSGAVQALGELRDIEVLLQQALGIDPLPLPFDVPSLELLSATSGSFAERYINRARSRCAGGRFSDKNPYNFLFLDVILRAFKNARIIHVYKHPLDACLGAFKHQFAAAAPWSYSLTDIAQFYELYHRVMCTWQRLYPGRICHVSYEALIQNLGQESRRLFEFCDLQWSDQVLNLKSSSRAVLSASANQVREGVHSRALFAHKNFEMQLQPFRQALLSKGLQPDHIWPFEVQHD